MSENKWKSPYKGYVKRLNEINTCDKLLKKVKNGELTIHSNKEKPIEEQTDCFVLIGVDENGEEYWDILRWMKDKDAFLWLEGNKAVYAPIENFEKWCYCDEDKREAEMKVVFI